MIYRNVKRSAAYHGLSLYARAALIELIDRYTGCNNGMIALGVRALAYELRCSKDMAGKALLELDDAKLAQPVTVGAWRGRRASEWRLTFYLCNKTGELPTTQWEQRPAYEPDQPGPKRQFESAQKDTEGRTEGRKANSSPQGRTREPKSSMNGSGLSTPGRTHIHIYQRDGESEGERFGREARERQVARWLKLGSKKEPR